MKHTMSPNYHIEKLAGEDVWTDDRTTNHPFSGKGETPVYHPRFGWCFVRAAGVDSEKTGLEDEKDWDIA